MKRSWFVLALLGLLLLAAAAIPVMADEHETPLDPHPHMLLHKIETITVGDDTFLVGFRNCVDLANGHAVPLHAHHDRLHFGTSGVSFMGGESGHVVIPSGYFPTVNNPLPWANCAEFEAFLSP